MPSISMVFGVLLLAAFIGFAAILAVVSEKTERHLKVRDRSITRE